MKPLLAPALKYAAADLTIFPVMPPGMTYTDAQGIERVADGKTPFRGTRGVLDASCDEAQVRAWWDDCPEANIAWRPWSSAVILDVDLYKPEAARAWADMPARLKALLETTPHAETGGGGLHFVLELPAGMEFICPVGLEYKTSSGYIVVGPSVHHTGNPYRWKVPLRRDRSNVIPVPAEWLRYAERSAPQDPAGAKPYDRSQAIDCFNLEHSLVGLLEKHGYIHEGGKRWRHPDSVSQGGVIVWEDQLRPRLFSHHANSDPLYDGPDSIGHDAYSAWTVLEHEGDEGRALAAVQQMYPLSNPEVVVGAPTDAISAAPDDAGEPAGLVRADWAALGAQWDAGELEPLVPDLGLRVDGAGLFYRTKMNMVFGAGGSMKTLLGLHVLAEEALNGGTAVMLDYEDSGRTAYMRLREMGVSHDTILRHIIHYTVETGLTAEVVATLKRDQPTLILFDSFNYGIAVGGGKVNDQELALQIAAALKPFGTVLFIDHITKDGEQHLYSLGGASKRNLVSGSMVRVDLDEQPAQGKAGRAWLVCTKDREGGIDGIPVEDHPHQTRVGALHLTPGPDSSFSLRLEPPAPDAVITALAEEKMRTAVWTFVEAHPECGVREIRGGVKGGSTGIDAALDELVRRDYIGVVDGKYGKQMHTVLKPYPEPDEVVVEAPVEPVVVKDAPQPEPVREPAPEPEPEPEPEPAEEEPFPWLFGSVSDCLAAMRQATEEEPVVVDIETTGLDPYADGARILTLQILAGGECYIFTTYDKRLRDLVAELGSVPWIAWNAAFDWEWLVVHAGLDPDAPGPLCAQLLTRMLGAGPNRDAALKKTAAHILGDYTLEPQKRLVERVNEVTGKKYTAKKAMGHLDELEHDDPALMTYGASDVWSTYRIWKTIYDAGEMKPLRAYSRAARAISRGICANGVPINIEKLKEIEAGEKEALARAKTQLQKLTDEVSIPVKRKNGVEDMVPFSWSNVRHVRVLFGTDDADAKTLQKMTASDHEYAWAAPYILAARKHHKELTGHVRPILRGTTDGRFRPSYPILQARTGRMSSRSPNFQNLRDELVEGLTVRRAIEAPPGMLLAELDFSQQELWVAAMISRDEAMLDALRGGDIHSQTSEALQIERKKAKAVTFATQYGAGPARIAEICGVEIPEAEDIRARFWRKYPQLDAKRQELEHYAARHGHIRTLMGRYIPIPRGTGGAYQTHKSLNSAVQGGAADITHAAIVKLVTEMPSLELVLTVHDSVIALVPEVGFEPTLLQARELMRGVVKLSICDMDVGIKVGRHWAALEEVDLEGAAH